MKQLLSRLKPGEKAIVSEHHSDEAVRQRLLDLGLMINNEIQLVRAAPLGDPIEIKVGLTHVVIRLKEADTVVVRGIK
ncbi:FeoA family protein [Vibrio sonorensis]|uniref:FeoA family protein n=1 Tax=Vibrio sonorensis TaxID=1004316 RepID=UPI0008D9FA0A|nr:FeoA family protein [Vibrio sonorensis]